MRARALAAVAVARTRHARSRPPQPPLHTARAAQPSKQRCLYLKQSN